LTRRVFLLDLTLLRRASVACTARASWLSNVSCVSGIAGLIRRILGCRLLDFLFHHKVIPSC